MAWLPEVTVTRKLLAGFGAVIVLMAIVSASGFVGLREIQASQHRVETGNFRNVTELAHLRANLNAERLDIAIMLALPRSERQPWLDEIRTIGSEDDRTLQALDARLRDDPASYQKLLELESLRNAFIQTRDTQILPLLNSGNVVAARDLYYGVQLDRFTRIRSLATELEQGEQEEATRVIADEEARVARYVIIIAAFGGTAVIAVVLLALYLNGTTRRFLTERRHIEGELRTASLHLRGLIEASLDPMFTISVEGKIIDANRAAETATGLTRERLIGTDFADYFTESDRARQGYRHVLSHGFVRDYPLTLRQPTGNVIEVSFNASVFKNEAGRVQGVFAAARDVTERRDMENRLTRSSAYTRSLIEASLDPLVTISPEGKITDVNKATEEVTGVPRDRLVGSDFADYFTEPEKARQGYQQVLAQGFVRDYPLGLRSVAGKITDVLYNASVFRNEAGRVQGVFAAARDITERKRAEREAAQLARRNRLILEAAGEGIYGLDMEGRCTFINPAAARMVGFAPDEMLGRQAHELIHHTRADGTAYPVMECEINAAYRQGQIHRGTDLYWRKDGSSFPVDFVSTPIQEEGRTVGAVVTFRDITERKKAEEEVRAAVRYTRSLIEASLDPLVTISPEGKITDVNKATENATGVPRERLIGSDFANYFTEPERARQGYQQVLAQGMVRDFALILRSVSGALTEVLYNASLFRDEGGRVQGVFAAARDVTERRQLENRLTEASAYTRNLIEASLDPLVTISPQGKITDVNKATEEVTGVPRERLVGSDFANYFTEPERARQVYQQVLAQGLVRDYPLAIRDLAGRITHVLYNATTFRNAAGDLQGVFAAARDVTERRELEQRVQERTIRLEKVLQEAREAVNVLTASASEILTAISQLATGASEAATSVSETTTTVEEVRQTAQLSNQKAKDIAESGQNAALVLQTGQRGVEAALAEMNRIRDQMGAIAETIVTLSEQSQAIGEITGTVNDLAEQSNLLAVNAAIEAAKAGEQGKGFAVVAQEIKSLAEQSKQATSQVKGLLADIQKAIANAVMATEQTSKVVDTGVNQSRQAGESIQVAVGATQRVANASSQIAISSQQQLTGVDQVAMAMESINKASAQNAQSTKQVESVAQNLHELSQKLKALVGP